MKACTYGQLTPIKPSELSIPASGHSISKVEFCDTDGKKQTGFYKPLDANYPALLAKYSVAVSVAMRFSLGDRAAEDRLVLDDNGEIIGTVSINLPNYKPLLSSGKFSPTNPHERELVVPSVKTLLKYNVAELLVAAWRYKCDDRHPGNFSLFALIDWDMTMYHITSLIKGQRLVDGVLTPLPEKGMTLKENCLDNFPNLEDRTHWPSHSWPGNLNLAKRCQAFSAFQALASNPSIKIEKDEIAFQDQLFSALLKELLTFDPDRLREWLREYLGDLTLDYLLPEGNSKKILQGIESGKYLSKEKSYKLSQAHPKWFYPKADKQWFVDHIMLIFQQEYEEFYRAVVFYRGCEKNRSGSAVMSFNRFLHNRPSAYQKICKWIKEQNEARWPLEGSVGNFNLLKIDQRYHKIWRDSHIFKINALLAQLRSLVNDLAKKLQENASLVVKESLSLESITETWQLLEIVSEKKIDYKEENYLVTTLKSAKKLRRELYKCAESYYKLPPECLNNEANQIFCSKVEKLLSNMEKETYPAFVEIINNLKLLNLDLQCHFMSVDGLTAQMGADFLIALKNKHTDEEVVNVALKALFRWIDKWDRQKLVDYILAITHDYGTQRWPIFSSSYRAEEVKKYLQECTEDGANCLANILSGGGDESIALNVLLVTKLFTQMMEETIVTIDDVNLASVRYACKNQQFDALLYAKRIRDYVLHDRQFTHPYAQRSKEQFVSVMYEWIGGLSPYHFKKIAKEALAAYSGASWKFFGHKNKKRHEEIGKLFDPYAKLSSQKILASLFCHGGKVPSSFNNILLCKLMEAVKRDLEIFTAVRDTDFGIVLRVRQEHLLSLLDLFQADAKLRMANETELLGAGEISDSQFFVIDTTCQKMSAVTEGTYLVDLRSNTTNSPRF